MRESNYSVKECVGGCERQREREREEREREEREERERERRERVDETLEVRQEGWMGGRREGRYSTEEGVGDCGKGRVHRGIYGGNKGRGGEPARERAEEIKK